MKFEEEEGHSVVGERSLGRADVRIKKSIFQSSSLSLSGHHRPAAAAAAAAATACPHAHVVGDSVGRLVGASVGTDGDIVGDGVRSVSTHA